MQIGHWQLIEPIGSGGGGTVFKARDPHSDQLVAVKQLNLLPGVDLEGQKQRFLREARAMAKINSDYVVRLYASQIIDDKPVLVMEYLPGSLAKDMEAGPLSPESVMQLLSEALQGLAEVHAAGVVHRDIKPTNILRSESGRYKIADFGISGPLGTMHTMHVGTAQYAAPEYATNPLQVDGRADMYSLGLVAYEAALGRELFQQALQHHTGVDPYVASAQWHAWLADGSKEVPPLHHVMPKVPLELSKLVARMLAKDPARRFNSCTAALLEVQQADVTARSEPAKDPSPHNTPREPAGKRQSKPPVLLVAVSLGATALIAVVGLVLRSPAKAPVPPTTISPAQVSPPPTSPPPAAPPTPAKADAWADFERLADQSRDRLLITNVRASYGIGDSMEMDIDVPRAGFLNVMTISDVTGVATVLFPNDFATDNHIAEAGRIRLPSSGSRYRLAFALPVGVVAEKNLLVAFLTEQPVNARELASNAAAFRELTAREASNALGGIVADRTYSAGKYAYLLNRGASDAPSAGPVPARGSR